MPRHILRPRKQGDRPRRSAHPAPLVEELRQIAIASGYTFETITEAAGVAESFFRIDNEPRLHRLQAVGEALGYQLKWVKNED